MTVTIYEGDCRKVLPTLAENSVHCCVTSPPYWGLRNYGTDRQIGMEAEVQAYIDTLVAVFAEVRRVLRPDGTLWLNLGDCYTGSGKGGHSSRIRSENWQPSYGKAHMPAGLKPKELVGLPWRVAFALQADGWYLRSDIIWHKPNPMPESVKDRPTRAHEFIFLFSKSRQYAYDYHAIREPLKDSSIARVQQDVAQQEGSDRAHAGGKTNGRMKAVVYGGKKHEGYGTTRHSGNAWEPQQSGGLVNKKSVWTVATCGLKEAHFATFPPKLIEPCIKAGCVERGVVLDPFFGAGTTALVAERLNRDCIGIELNGGYIGIARKRLEEDSGMFADIHVIPSPDPASHSIAA
ncbi:MAG: site-specific DNA-methyltransferase [Azospirillum brasilense]|nr:MAG: site-specific DNA-methyltransferase [Azospirillum brasilense]